MDYQKILSIACDKIGSQHTIVSELKKRIAAGSSGSEIWMAVGKYLKDLEINDNHAYSILRKDILDYLSECERYGLIIH